MGKDINTILVILDGEEIQQIILEVLEEQDYRVITATNSNEARLKYANEPFDFIIIDMDMTGLDALAFLENVRRKEAMRNVTDRIPFMVLGEDAKEYQVSYGDLDNAKFLEKPFSPIDFKKKMLSYTGHADVISENTKSITQDDYLITEGGESNEMYWVLSGQFRITKMNQDGQNVIIGEVFPGELVGEMSFLDGMPRSASVKAMEDSEVLVIPHKRFIDVLEGQPRWFRSLMRTLSQRLRNANKMIARKYATVDDEDKNASNTEGT
jgi:CRP/FNR family cyclic AMP-dependent transcriptional regulator